MKKILRTIKNIFDGMMIFLLFITTTAYALPSDGVIYDNSESGSTATNVNDALNDLYSKINQKQEELNSINNIGNAASNHILSGYTAYVKGKTVTGTIPSKGATTYTPGTKDQTIAAEEYISGIQTIKGDANLVAGNIAKGKSIFGISGTYTSDANAAAGNILSGYTAYVNGSKITGSMANQTGSTGLTLTSTDKRPVKVVKRETGDSRIWYLNNSDGVQRLNIGVPSYGYYDTNVTLAIGNTDIANALGINASKVAKGQTIAGVAGSYTSDANAVAGNILKDKTAYVNGSKITGSMTNWSGKETTFVDATGNITSVKDGQWVNGLGAGAILKFKPYFTGYVDGNTIIQQEVYGLHPSVVKAGALIGGNGSPDGVGALKGTFTSDATATAADITSGKTAYVNGNKITGTGGGAKVYTFDRVQTTVSSSNTFKSGTWVILAKKDETTKFTASLGFTPSKVISCELYLYGNYSSSLSTSVDHSFRFARGSDAYWYKNPLEATYKGTYMTNTDNPNIYSDTYTQCRVSGSNIVFEIRNSTMGASSGFIQTRADAFYLSGTLVYE